MGFGQHSAEGARKRTRGPWAVGAGHMGRARGEGGGGVCGPGRGCGRGGCGGCCDGGGVGVGRGCMRCSARRYATLRCAAALLLSATCDGARPWAAKGGSANDEASARPQVRRRATLLKPPIRPRDAIVRKLVSTADAPPAMRGTVNMYIPVYSSRCCCHTHTHAPSLYSFFSLSLSPEMCRHGARMLRLAGQPLHHAKQRVQCMCVYAHMSASIQVCLYVCKYYAYRYIDQPPTAQCSAVPCRAKSK